MRVRIKWPIVVSIGVLVMILAAGPVMAEEKVKIKGKSIMVVVDRTSHKIGDVDGHVMGMVHAQGVDVIQKMTVYSYSAADMVKFKGPFQGWTKAVRANGDITFSTFKGQLIPKLSPQGKPMLLMKGTWKFTSGTGKWAGVQGGGTFTGHYLSPTIYIYNLEGEATLKK